MGKKCAQCGKLNHFKVMCRNKPKVTRIVINNVFGADHAPQVKVWLNAGQCKPVLLQALPDTGAKICIIGQEMALQVGMIPNLFDKTQYEIQSANKMFEVVGQKVVTVKFQEKMVETTCIVCRDYKGMVLSWSVSEKLGIVTYNPDMRAEVHHISTNEKTTSNRNKSNKWEQKSEHIPLNPSKEEIARFRENILIDFEDVFTNDDKVERKLGANSECSILLGNHYHRITPIRRCLFLGDDLLQFHFIKGFLCSISIS